MKEESVTEQPQIEQPFSQEATISSEEMHARFIFSRYGRKISYIFLGILAVGDISGVLFQNHLLSIDPQYPVHSLDLVVFVLNIGVVIPVACVLFFSNIIDASVNQLMKNAREAAVPDLPKVRWKAFGADSDEYVTDEKNIVQATRKFLYPKGGLYK